MTHIDELERTILEDARAFIEPNRADELRVFSRLAVDLGLSGVATISGSEHLSNGVATMSGFAPLKPGSMAGLRHLLGTRKAVALSFALLGAGAGFGAGYIVGQKSNRAEVAQPTATVEARAVGAAHAPAAVADEAVETNVDRALAAAVAPHAVSPEPTLRRRPSASETGGGTSPSAVADPIGEEVALLKRAERAIRGNSALLALGLLRELDERFPRGKLLDERAAARVMASCQQLAPEAARRAGETYLRSAKNSVYHERVRQLCGISLATPNQTRATPNQKNDSAEKGSSGAETNPR